MGLTIGNKNHSIDMGYGGFLNLRTTIAGILSPELKKLYEDWITQTPFNRISDDEGNRRLEELYSKGVLKEEDDCIIDFLFASDCGGTISFKNCKKLYKLIKDYDDNVLYGYYARPNCAKFKDFKLIVEECASRRLILRWY